MSFDYICAPLVCPACGQQASNPCDIDLQTKIARVPAQHSITVGDRIELLDDPRELGYLPLNADWRPGSGRLRVIEEWSCPVRGENPLWANLTFEDGTLASVEPSALDAAHLANADFIASGVLFLVPPEAAPKFEKLSPADLIQELVRLGQERTP